MNKDENRKQSEKSKERYKPINLDTLMDDIKKRLKQKLNITKADIERLDKIEKYSQDLDEDVGNLGETIQKILDRQYDEYLATFTKFMDTVKKDLIKKQTEMEEEKRIVLQCLQSLSEGEDGEYDHAIAVCQL